MKLPQTYQGNNTKRERYTGTNDDNATSDNGTLDN